MTPDALKHLFDTNAIIIMFIWGLLHKYVPQLAKLPNELIPWINAIGYIVASLAGGLVSPANAGGLTQEQGGLLLGVGGALLGAFTNASWARLLYEGFAKAALEGMFKWKKATA
jgi:hypothetical protein